MNDIPAFPITGSSGLLSMGMTLRDYFAAAALPAAIYAAYQENDGSIREIASAAYQYADAMLKARDE